MANGHELTTYEQVEAYVDRLEAEQSAKPPAPGMGDAQADIGAQLQEICKYYKIVKPILDLVLRLPLIPEKVKKPIKDFMGILDTLCT